MRKERPPHTSGGYNLGYSAPVSAWRSSPPGIVPPMGHIGPRQLRGGFAAPMTPGLRICVLNVIDL